MTPDLQARWALAAWAAEDAEGRVMTIVEDPSLAEYVPVVLAELDRYETVMTAAADWLLDREPRDDAERALMAALSMALARCYVCSAIVLPSEGWWREGSAWCPKHQPVWSQP